MFVIIDFQVFRRILDGRKEMFEEDQGRNLLRMLYEIVPKRTGTKQRDGNLLGWNIWKAHVVLHVTLLTLSAPWALVVSEYPYIIQLLFHTFSYCFILFHNVS